MIGLTEIETKKSYVPQMLKNRMQRAAYVDKSGSKPGNEIVVDGVVRQPLFPYPLMNLSDSENGDWTGVVNLVLGKDKSVPLTKMMLRKKFED